ncbi:MAG TPA: alpha/beta hydrolase [Burkholderiales bacterium]|nr:alpha/beta hydrolase [Burkholderiales bacterium]
MIRSRYAEAVNGLRMHYLEAGERGRPAVLLLHGFPELSYSWRKVMPALAEAGFHVIAPDQRGYGETTGWDGRYDGELDAYRMLNLVEDAAQLLSRLGIATAHVVGHDFGSPVAAYCAMTRPQIFRSLVLMSAPFGGVSIGTRDPGIHQALAALGRKHYQWYYSTREADADMRECSQGVHAFLRAYYHYKSADWKGNQPYRLEGWTAAELVKMPTYYIMDLDKGMAETVAPYMPSLPSRWLTDTELEVYARAFERNGFQGGLQWYRCVTSPHYSAQLASALGGKTIDVPSMFIAGAADWGVYQKPGEFERMQESVCTDFRGAHLVEGAGHWVQQEQPERTARLLIDFLIGL